MDQDPKTLGEQIAVWRKADGMTQRQLATLSGVPLTAIRRCEQKGQIPMDRYARLVSALGGVLKPVRPARTKTPEKLSDPEREHFLKKAKWKSLPGNRYQSGDRTPVDNMEWVTNPSVAGFELDWA